MSQKQIRQQRLLEAAASLIRTSGGTDFSMLALAEEAGVSPATPYNLLGSKVGVLWALLNYSLDTVLERLSLLREPSDPFERVVQAAALGAEVFTSEADFYRPLYRFLLGCGDPVNRPQFMDRALAYWMHSTTLLNQLGYLRAPIDQAELSREMEIHFLGVLDLWVQHELDDDEFEAQIVFGTALMLLAVADDPGRAKLMKHLQKAKRKLPRDFSFARMAARATAKAEKPLASASRAS
jgi:AcrR family transcriptional regulator